MAKALIITAPGINCDLELDEAFECAGASTFNAHINELMDDPSIIDEADLIGLPGGFSYGDAVAAGRIMAGLMRQTMYAQFVKALKRGVPMIAPCNGFQIAVQLGLLPGPTPGQDWTEEPAEPTVALAQNNTARFIDRWVGIDIPQNTRCVWTKDLDVTEQGAMIPIAHGEGRFHADEDTLKELNDYGQVMFQYCDADGNVTPEANPNGSIQNIAGICSEDRNVMGMMPHPERASTQELLNEDGKLLLSSMIKNMAEFAM